MCRSLRSRLHQASAITLAIQLSLKTMETRKSSCVNARDYRPPRGEYSFCCPNQGGYPIPGPDPDGGYPIWTLDGIPPRPHLTRVPCHPDLAGVSPYPGRTGGYPILGWGYPLPGLGRVLHLSGPGQGPPPSRPGLGNPPPHPDLAGVTTPCGQTDRHASKHDLPIVQRTRAVTNRDTLEWGGGGVATHSGATSLLSMRAVWLASAQRWLCVDADVWRKPTLNGPDASPGGEVVVLEDYRPCRWVLGQHILTTCLIKLRLRITKPRYRVTRTRSLSDRDRKTW